MEYADILAHWSHGTPQPQYAEATLEVVRAMATEIEPAKHLVEFLDATKDLPGTVIVAMAPGEVALLTSDDGKSLLEWN